MKPNRQADEDAVVAPPNNLSFLPAVRTYEPYSNVFYLITSHEQRALATTAARTVSSSVVEFLAESLSRRFKTPEGLKYGLHGRTLRGAGPTTTLCYQLKSNALVFWPVAPPGP